MAIVGIDLGTTNSLVAAFQEGASVLIPNGFGEVLTPSVVSLNDRGEIIVGKAAKERLVTHPERTAALFKRKMGLTDTIPLGSREFTPEQLSSFVIRQLVSDAEAYLGEKVEEAVISVPAYFDVSQRAATKRAGALAGVRVERLVNEPSSAALGHHRFGEDECFIVFDFGGGTLDVSVVECFDNVVSISAVAGDNALGGADFDEVIAREMCRHNDVSFELLSQGERQSLMRAAEKAKHDLGTGEEAFVKAVGQTLSRTMMITNEQLFRLSEPLFTRMEKPIKQAVYDSDIPNDEIDGVILVGGSCRMPVVKRYLEMLLAIPVLDSAECDRAVARGLGIYAGIKERRSEVSSLVLTDICPFSLSTDVANHQPPYHALSSVIIPRNTTLPVSRSRDYHIEKASMNDRTWSQGMMSKERKIDLAIYQGENIYAKDNVKLVDLPVRIPRNTKAAESFTVTFTYDINAILTVDVLVKSTGESTSFAYSGGSWVEAEAAASLIEDVRLAVAMNTMQLEVDFTIERAHRIAAESNERDREHILFLLGQFANTSRSNSLKEVIETTRRFNEILDSMEAERNDGGIFRR